MTNAEARFSNYLRPRKPEGSLGRTAQDVHLDSHTAPELCYLPSANEVFICCVSVLVRVWCTSAERLIVPEVTLCGLQDT